MFFPKINNIINGKRILTSLRWKKTVLFELNPF